MMNSALLKHITLLLIVGLSFAPFAQENPVDQRWKQMNERIEYFPSNDPQGPENRYNYPPNMNEGGSTSSGGSFTPSQVSDDDIRYSREQRYPNGGGSQGVKKRIKDSESDDLDDLTTPDSDAPDIDPPDFDPSIESDGTFWKVLFIIIGVVLLAFIIYQLFFKGKQTNDVAVAPANYHDDELDPSTIKKSQLEIDLDAAIAKEDYRLAVRILYTMTLKRLVEKNWIVWEKKKTNYNYLLEMNKRSERDDFDKSIRIFEWVWYGKNVPTEEEFKTVDRFYRKFIKHLNVD